MNEKINIAKINNIATTVGAVSATIGGLGVLTVELISIIQDLKERYPKGLDRKGRKEVKKLRKKYEKASTYKERYEILCELDKYNALEKYEKIFKEILEKNQDIINNYDQSKEA